MKLRIVTHIVLFVLAFGIFYVGLAVGLQQDADWGTILWAVAMAIVVLNIAWMLLAGRRRKKRALR